MIRSLLLAATMGALSCACAAAPIYYVADGRSAPSNRKLSALVVRAFDDGDAGACARAQLRNRSPDVTSCVHRLPSDVEAILRDQAVAMAYVVKVTSPEWPGATYTLRYGMSMRDPAEVCKNLVSYEKRYSSPYVLRYGHITCTVPR